MAILKILRGAYRFDMDQTFCDIPLAETIQKGFVFPLLHSRNDNESTYLGSAGNFLFTPTIPRSGNSFRVERTQTNQQVMWVYYQLIIFDTPIVTSEEIMVGGYQTSWSQVISSQDFSRIYLEGAYSGASNIAQLYAYNDSYNCLTNAPINTKATIYSVPFSGDLELYLSWQLNQKSQEMHYSGENAFCLNNFSASEGATLNGRDIFTTRYDSSAKKLIVSSHNNTPQNGETMLSGSLQTTMDAYTVQYVTLILTTSSYTYPLPKAVADEQTLIVATGPNHSYGKVDTWEEEHGDFSVTFTPILNGNGEITTLLVERGERNDMPQVEVSIAIITFNTDTTIIPDILLSGSIMRGVGVGIMKGIE